MLYMNQDIVIGPTLGFILPEARMRGTVLKFGNGLNSTKLPGHVCSFFCFEQLVVQIVHLFTESNALP